MLYSGDRVVGHPSEDVIDSGHTERVGVERSGMPDDAAGNHVHQFATAAEGSHWHTAADRLAKNGQVRLDDKASLGARTAEADAGDRLVGDEQTPATAAHLVE